MNVLPQTGGKERCRSGRIAVASAVRSSEPCFRRAGRSQPRAERSPKDATCCPRPSHSASGGAGQCQSDRPRFCRSFQLPLRAKKDSVAEITPWPEPIRRGKTGSVSPAVVEAARRSGRSAAQRLLRPGRRPAQCRIGRGDGLRRIRAGRAVATPGDRRHARTDRTRQLRDGKIPCVTTQNRITWNGSSTLTGWLPPAGPTLTATLPSAMFTVVPAEPAAT